jgi:putative nucleotidyltransferase with HDIG domain
MGDNGTGISQTVLFVDDDAGVLNSIERLFPDSKLKMLKAAVADEALALLEKEDVAVIIWDNKTPGLKGTELLAKVRDISPDTLRILMTEHADLTAAVEAAMKGEVFRFITKPWDDDVLVQTVQDAANRYHLVQSLKDHDESRRLALAQTIELKAPHTRGHCKRVADYALAIANALDLPEWIRRDLKYGCWLHDCGNTNVPEHILNKKGPLDPEEFEIVKNHPGWGAEIALQAQLPETIVKIIHHHHERHDGTGYPAGIKGSDIPLEARIVTVADVYDALTTDRPYRKSYSREKALAVMLSMRGSVFDPELVDVFLRQLPRAREHVLKA